MSHKLAPYLPSFPRLGGKKAVVWSRVVEPQHSLCGPTTRLQTISPLGPPQGGKGVGEWGVRFFPGRVV